MAGRNEEAQLVGEEALANARHHGDPEVLAAALQSATVYSLEPRRFLRDSSELAELGRQLGNGWIGAFGQACQVRGHLCLAQLDEARARLRDLWLEADRGRFMFYRYQALAFGVALAVAHGRFDEAERLAGEAHELGAVSHTDFDAGVYGLHMFVIRREQGRLGEVAPVLRLAATLQPGEPVWRPGLAACFAETGMLDDARREFERLAPDGFAAVPRDAMWPCCLSFLAETCVALGDQDRAKLLYRELEAFRGQTLMVAFTISLGPAERLMGSLAALAGRPVEAETHFAAALALAERAGSPVWTAHAQHDWAVALGDRPDLLAAAETTATELGMDALAQRCRDRAASPSPSAGSSPPDGLSGREVEVLRLVAAGCSNREIGERLFISQNTAANHMRSILQKTASANRAEATAYAARHGLLSS
jgi:DNA-binding CsgD family transcriptional regulator